MASITSLLRITLLGTGEQEHTWGVTTNDNLVRLEEAITQAIEVATTGGTTALSETQERAAVIKFTGTLVSNATIEVSGRKKTWIFWNATSGAFTLTVKKAGGTGVVIAQGKRVKAFFDGTEAFLLSVPDIAIVDVTGLQAALDAKLDEAGGTMTGDLIMSGAEIQLANGAAGNPALQFASDTNTGLFRIGEDQIGFAVNGALAASIVAGGLRGIDIVGLTAETAPAIDDQILFSDTSEGANNRMTFENFMKVTNLLTTKAVPLAADMVAGYSVADSAARKFAVSTIGIGQQTVNLLAAGLVSRTTNGPTAFSTELPTNDVMIKGFEFSATVEQAIQIRFPLPKGFNPTPGLVFRFFWTTGNTAGTGDVIWAARARYVRDDDANDGAYGTAQTVTDTFLADDDEHITAETPAVTPGGTFASECMLAVEIYRDADAGGDTYSQTAVLEACMMHYTTSANTDD